MDPEFLPRVYFAEINPDALIIRLIYWYSPPNPWNYFAFGETLNPTSRAPLDPIDRQRQKTSRVRSWPLTAWAMRHPTC